MTARETLVHHWHVRNGHAHRQGTKYCEGCEYEIDDLLKALSAAGYAVVPVDPTNSMRLAGIGVDDGKGNPVWVGLADGGIDVRAIINSYKAMLTAAKGE